MKYRNLGLGSLYIYESYTQFINNRVLTESFYHAFDINYSSNLVKKVFSHAVYL